MKKGFTLIELLAIIIILAIVALVATPIVLNVVDSSKDSVARTEASAFVSGIETNCQARAMLADNNTDGFTACGSSISATDVKGLVNVGNATLVGTAVYENGKVTSLTVSSNGRTVTYSGGSYTVTKAN